MPAFFMLQCSIVCTVLLCLGSSPCASCQAQVSPVQIEVKPLSKKKDVAVSGRGQPQERSESRALSITLRNSTAQPVNGILVRWGIVKLKVDFVDKATEGVTTTYTYAKHKPMAYGSEEKVDLGPLQSKTIETIHVSAKGMRGQHANMFYSEGQRILGHGVLVFINGKVVAQAMAPPVYRPLFDQLGSINWEPDGPHEFYCGQCRGKQRASAIVRENREKNGKIVLVVRCSKCGISVGINPDAPVDRPR